MKSDCCPTCGAKTVEYWHSMTKGICTSLQKLHKAGNRANINRIGLTSNERNNFQKLRYWGLVSQTHTSGEWRVTRKGLDFLSGVITISKRVKTYRGKIVEYSSETVSILEKSFMIDSETAKDFVENREGK